MFQESNFQYSFLMYDQDVCPKFVYSTINCKIIFFQLLLDNRIDCLKAQEIEQIDTQIQ